MRAPTKPPEGKPPAKLSDPVAIARDGNAFLLVERADRDAKNWSGWAQCDDLDASTQRSLSACEWLQVWFKFGEWEDCGDRAYRQALKRRSEREAV